ncbi:MAG TPA: polyprenyl synthetase family protein [Polyangiales bacterium]|nr:polyprenyl synthetase family protein [Polyangiales bacterium]
MSPRGAQTIQTKARAIEPWIGEVTTGVNARLEEFFAEKMAHASELSPRAPELISAVEDLTMRGGKRLRPLAIYAGFRAITPQVNEWDWRALLTLGAALELLQTYLLIQDDWMDDDEQRRGGLSTHTALTRKHGDARLGASLAILAGDVAMGFAIELLHATEFPPSRTCEALRSFGHMHMEVVFGQQLDLLGHEDVTLTQHLKTGSYTLRGPIALGALLANASTLQMQTLMQFAQPLGIAFQLRDDLLATFGDPAHTGKPVGHDLREGKYTALVAEARRLLSATDRACLDRVLGDRKASPEAIHAAMRMFEYSGARARVEAKLIARLSEARNALKSAHGLDPVGSEMLRELIDRVRPV